MPGSFRWSLSPAGHQETLGEVENLSAERPESTAKRPESFAETFRLLTETLIHLQYNRRKTTYVGRLNGNFRISAYSMWGAGK